MRSDGQPPHPGPTPPGVTSLGASTVNGRLSTRLQEVIAHMGILPSPIRFRGHCVALGEGFSYSEMNAPWLPREKEASAFYQWGKSVLASGLCNRVCALGRIKHIFCHWLPAWSRALYKTSLYASFISENIILQVHDSDDGYFGLYMSYSIWLWH